MVTAGEIRRINRGLDRQLAELERKYTAELNRFYNRYVKPLAEIMPADSIRKKHEQRVRNMLRQMVEQAYNVGTDLVGREIKRKDPDFVKFTSRSDVANIEDKTNELNTRFWNSIDKLVNRKNTTIIKQDKLGNSTEEHKPEFDEKAEMAGTATHVLYDAYNLGVRAKMVVIGTAVLRASPLLAGLGQQALNRQVPQVPTSIQKTQTNKILIRNTPPLPDSRAPPPTGPGIEAGGDPTHLLTIRELNSDLLFLTKEDPKVDKKICAPLNRTIYDKDEPDIPTPPLHKNCRCILVPLV